MSMEFKYSYVALKKEKDTIDLEKNEYIYIPVLSEIEWCIERINYLLYNKKIWVLQSKFRERLNSTIGNYITELYIDAPAKAEIYISLGGVDIPYKQDMGDISIPCVEYHSVEIHGNLTEEYDKITIYYTLKDMITPIEKFTIGDEEFIVSHGLYCKLMT